MSESRGDFRAAGGWEGSLLPYGVPIRPLPRQLQLCAVAAARGPDTQSPSPRGLRAGLGLGKRGLGRSRSQEQELLCDCARLPRCRTFKCSNHCAEAAAPASAGSRRLGSEWAAEIREAETWGSASHPLPRRDHRARRPDRILNIGWVTIQWLINASSTQMRHPGYISEIIFFFLDRVTL